MADTGAPHFIPYIEPTDLVRDYPAADEAQAEAVAAGLTAAGNAGIGSNVVQTVKTNIFSSASSTFEDVTGMSVDFTPSSATSKVLVIASFTYSIDSGRGAHFTLRRGSTDLLIGDGAGSRVRSSVGRRFQNNDASTSATIVFLDSPSVDTQVTYVLAGRVGGGGFLNFNRNRADADSVESSRTASTLTAIEVAA